MLRDLMTSDFSCVAFDIETSHSICSDTQMVGFYMKFNTELKWFKN